MSKFAECMGYCQVQIINYFHLGIKPEITEAVRAGSEVHQKLEKLDKLIPRVKATRDELADPQVDLDIPRESLRVKILRSNKNVFTYLGRIDKAIRKSGDVYIIDDRVSKAAKSGHFQSKILQLSCYCEGFSRNYAGLLKFNGIIFQIVQRYDRKRKRFLLENFRTFEKIYNKEIAPEHCGSAAKCGACSYGCEFRL